MSLDSERRSAIFTIGLAVVTALLDVAVAFGALPRLLWIALTAFALALFGFGFYSLFVTNARIATRDRMLALFQRLYRTAMRKPSFHVRTLRDEGEVSALEQFDEKYYGPSALPSGQLVEWWKAYRPGIFAAFDGNAIVAAIGIWPLTHTAYRDLRNARRSETAITPQSFCRTPRKCVYWYAAGVSVDDRVRTTTVLHDLMRTALISFQETLDVRTVNLVAVATSPQGMNLLRRSGFNALKPKGTSADPHQRFIIEGIDLRELRRRVKMATT